MNDFINENIFDIEWDLIVIPVSTVGTISRSFQEGLEKYFPDYTLKKRVYKLGDIEIEKLNDKKLIALACSVEEFSSSYATIRKIGKNLADSLHNLKSVREIATPILGTGAGNLDPFYSRNIMLNAFYESQKQTAIRLTFCTPDKYVYNIFEGRSLNIDIPSGQLVIEAEIPTIAQNEIIRELQSSEEFYYDLAEKKFYEYLDYNNSGSDNFYQKLEEKFKSSMLSFQDFLSGLEKSDAQNHFVTLCGELIAYIDYHAYKKNIWNQYPDKRVLARSSVRQNNWFINLIKFKQTGNLNTLSSSIRNAIQYLKDPDSNITMLSEKHRLGVYQEILNINNDETNTILGVFRKLGFATKNPRNFGALCSRILYLPFIKTVWLDPNIKSEDDIIDEGRENVGILQASLLIEKCYTDKAGSLDLGNCGLNDLSIIPELFECTHLEELILSNEWSTYENGKWRKNVSENTGDPNRLGSLPKELKKLKKLKKLICGGDWNNEKTKWNRWNISNLSVITDLPNLEYLNLSNNRLKNVRGINKLGQIRSIHLNNNEIVTIESLSDLKKLKEIFLSNNLLKSISFLQGARHIETIDLHNNQIKDLRAIEDIISLRGIVNDKWKVGTINVAKNPLEQPPMEIVNIGKDAVLRTFEDVKKRGRYVNKDIKVILVGNSEAGKSTLAKYIDNETELELEHPATLWMEEKTVKSKYKIHSAGENCVLHIFDFGGHDYFHDTHHIFYSTNAVYMLLWDEKTNNLNFRKCVQENKLGEKIEVDTQDYPVKYWLDSIKYHIKDIEADNFEFEINRENTYSSSILIIQNKVSDASKISFLNNEKLRADYTFVYDIINISIKNPKRNLTHFDATFEEMLNCMKIVGAILPKYYEFIKNSIEKYSGKPVINTSEFNDYCNSILNTPIDEEQSKILIKYLKQIGLLLYSENQENAKVYINKKWVIENIHKVLLNLVKQYGEFDRKYVENTLENTKKEEVDDILQMMLDFKMIFKHPFKESYIAPLYLPKMPEAKIKLFLNERVKPYRRFEYSGFIQKNVVLNIFQQYSKLISLDRALSDEDTFYYWKDGLIMKKTGTTEIVMIKFNLGNADGNAYIDIYDISNEGKNPIFILEVIQYIKEINKGYDIEEMVTLDGVDFISIDILEKNAKQGKLVFSEKKLADFRQQKNEEKIFHLKHYKNYMTQKIKRKKVVISYSKKDLANVHALKRYLQPLVDAELIEEPWYCTSMLPGDNWDSKIKWRFDEADIIFFMISEYFYSTKYIVDHEITNAIDRYDNGEPVKIIPVILEFYDWGRKGKFNLQRFSALPYQGKPISDFNNPKMAWNTITISVKMMIEKDLDPGKIEVISRDIQEIYERQVKGKLDNNS